MSTTLSIQLKRASKVYHEGETVAGVVVVDSSTETRHEGLTLVLEGSVSLQLSNKNTGILDAFSNNVKTTKMRRLLTSFPKHLPHLPFHKKCAPRPTRVSSDPSLQTADGSQDTNAAEELGPERNKSIETSFKMFESKEKTPLAFPINLITTALELAAPGKIPAGVTEIPFEVPLRARGPVSAGYPGLLETYHGVFVNVMYCLKATMRRPLFNKPLNASCQFFLQYRQIRVDSCSAGIKSIELQLVRVETCGGAEGGERDATEVQNIQVGCGDVLRGRALPLHMVLPRLFTAPTTASHHFKIEFELNIAVIFEDDYLITENFPILLLRCK